MPRATAPATARNTKTKNSLACYHEDIFQHEDDAFLELGGWGGEASEVGLLLLPDGAHVVDLYVSSACSGAWRETHIQKSPNFIGQTQAISPCSMCVSDFIRWQNCPEYGEIA